MAKRSLLACVVLLSAARAFTQTMGTLSGTADTSKAAAGQSDPAAMKAQAGQGFDSAGGSGGFVSPPPVLAPVSSPRTPSADLIVGEPGRHHIREPKSPLTEDGKPVKQKSGNQLWWALGGAAVGAGVGFLLAGPIGAVIGGLALGILGYIFGP